MIPLSLTSSPSAPPFLRPSHTPSLRGVQSRYNQLKKLRQRRLRHGNCRAEFSADAPVAAAIGACILSSLILPETPSPEDGESESPIDTDDARFAVMGIISFIPYFNWMSWVFAWLDSGKSRYAVYAIVYLAPYLRSNLSISPEDSWLPIASILLGIAHIQLEASIKNGDIKSFLTANHLSSMKKHDGVSDDEDFNNLPSARERCRNEMRNWAPRKREEDREIWNEDEDVNGGAKPR